MKQIITLFAVLFAMSANAQLQRRFTIDPYVIQTSVITPETTYVERSDTATQVAAYIAANDKDSATIQYALYKADSFSIIRIGNRTVSNTAAGVLLVFPINIANLNNFILGAVSIEALTEY